MGRNRNSCDTDAITRSQGNCFRGNLKETYVEKVTLFDRKSSQLRELWLAGTRIPISATTV